MKPRERVMTERRRFLCVAGRIVWKTRRGLMRLRELSLLRSITAAALLRL